MGAARHHSTHPLYRKRKTAFKFHPPKKSKTEPYRATEDELAQHCYAPQTKEQEM